MAQCTAHSTRTGKRCNKHAIAGGNVCGTHGGSAPQVRKAAALRVLELVNPALANLAKDLRSKNPAIRQKATFDVLDRAGLKGTDKLQMFGPEDSADIDLESLTDEQLAALRAISAEISCKSTGPAKD